MALERKNYDELAKPVGPYTHAVESNGLLFLSGVTAFGTSAQGGSIADQTHAVFDQIEAIAKAEGTNLQSLVKVTIFITDFAGVTALRNVLFERYAGSLPASSLVQVTALFSSEVNIEIEGVLAVR